MRRQVCVCAAIGSLALYLPCTSPAANTLPPLKMVCGKVKSIGAPKDVQSTSQFFGFELEGSSARPYPPEPHKGDWDLGVMRDNRDAIGIAFTLSAAYAGGGLVTIWYQPHDPAKSALPNAAVCAMAEHKDKCPDIAEGECKTDPAALRRR